MAYQIIDLVNEIYDLTGQFHEIEYKNLTIREDLSKYLTEISLLDLEIDSINEFDPISKSFPIRLYEEYGMIRQHPLKFPSKPNFKEVRNAIISTYFKPMHWKEVNHAFGAILWLLAHFLKIFNWGNLD